jgi:hypothetical protein
MHHAIDTDPCLVLLTTMVWVPMLTRCTRISFVHNSSHIYFVERSMTSASSALVVVNPGMDPLIAPRVYVYPADLDYGGTFIFHFQHCP